MTKDFEEGRFDPNNPIHRIANEMGMVIALGSKLHSNPEEEHRVRIYIAKSLGLNGPLDQMTTAQNAQIEKAFEAAFSKAAAAAAQMKVMYKTAEEIADALIRAVPVKKEPYQGK